MSDLKHVRDPVTGRCIACEALSKSAADPTYHPELAGGGLMVTNAQARPVTPVHFDPNDPNYIRAVRRGSVSLYKGQGIYAHHGATEAKAWPSPQAVAATGPPTNDKGQLMIVDGGGNTQPDYKVVQQPNTVMMNNGPRYWPNPTMINATGNNRIDPQPQTQTIIIKQPTKVANNAGTNLYGTNYYGGAPTGRTGYGSGSGAAKAGCCMGCAAGCGVCCASCSPCCSCSSCCYNQDRARRGVPPKQKRNYWNAAEDDSKGRCCKGCLVGLIMLLFLLLLLAIILAIIYGLEANNQTVNLDRRFLFTYNDTICRNQLNSTGSTAANCAFTSVAEQIVDATFTNPPTSTFAAAMVTANPNTIFLILGFLLVKFINQ